MSTLLVVDENDVALGSKARAALLPGELYRVSALWLANSKGEVLMAQRAYTKEKDPGVWGPAAAGTVEESEDYDTNIVKEIQEELGILIPLEKLARVAKTRVGGKHNDYFVQWYSAVLDKPAEDFIFQKQEVEQVKWFSPDELRTKIQANPEEFTPAASQWLKLFLK